jgi:ABC-2 type transport system ATP-binding protein
MMDKDIALKTNNLEKMSGRRLIMADVCLNLHEGEIFALVGESSSGKTLLSKILVNVSRKSGGSVKINHHNFIGVALERQQFLPMETVQTTIKDYCKINARTINMKRVKNTLALVNLRDKLHTKVRDLSASELTLLKTALPVIVRADVIILDNPSANLTDEENRELGVLLKTLAEKLKTAVIITAKRMDKIEAFCDTIGIIDDGMIVAIKSYNEFIDGDKGNAKISIKTTHPNYAAQVIEQRLRLRTHLCGDCVIVNAPPEDAQQIADILYDKKIDIIAVTKVHRPLQELYYEIVKSRRNYY